MRVSWALATITMTSKKPQLMGLFRKECERDWDRRGQPEARGQLAAHMARAGLLPDPSGAHRPAPHCEWPGAMAPGLWGSSVVTG